VHRRPWKITDDARIFAWSVHTRQTGSASYFGSRRDFHFSRIRPYKALEGGHQEVVETLIEAGADVNVSLLYGRTPLHFAAAMGQEHAALYLLRSGANTGIRDMFGSTA
jgi:hypothetical protein